jgi:DNA-binding MarR family transcriptional regulator
VNSECYASSARIAARQLTSRYDEALEDAGVTLAQFSLMRRLARLGHASLTALAESARLERSTAGRNVRVLEKRDLVVRSTGQDQREQIFELTAHGQQVLLRALPLWQAVQNGIEAELGEGRAHDLRGLLHAMS